MCDSGGTSQAAEQLQISQATLNRHIRELESLLNVKLLARSSGSITLTDAGRLLRTHSHNVLKYLAVATEALRSGGAIPSKRAKRIV